MVTKILRDLGLNGRRRFIGPDGETARNGGHSCEMTR